MERNVLAGVMIQSFERYSGAVPTRTAEWVGYRVVLMPYRVVMRNQGLLTSS